MKQEPINRNSDKQDFPGYPHYPATEDITQPGNNNGKISASEEDISLPDTDESEQQIIAEPLLTIPANQTTIDEDDEVKIVMGTEADVTEEDLQLLDDAHGGLDITDEDGDLLNENATGKELDVPGSEDDDANEEIGEEDEANNYYSRSQNDDENIEDTEGIP